MVLIKPAGIPHCAKISRCAWENSDVSLSVQDFHRLHFEIVTSAAASIPKEVRADPERGSGPVSQAHLERGLRLDLYTEFLWFVSRNWFIFRMETNKLFFIVDWQFDALAQCAYSDKLPLCFLNNFVQIFIICQQGSVIGEQHYPRPLCRYHLFTIKLTAVQHGTLWHSTCNSTQFRSYTIYKYILSSVRQVWPKGCIYMPPYPIIFEFVQWYIVIIRIERLLEINRYTNHIVLSFRHVGAWYTL